MNMESENTELADHESSNGHGNGGGNGVMAHAADTSPSCGGSGLKGILEALLFVSGEPLVIDRMIGILEGASRAEVHEAMRGLQADYAAAGRGLQIVEVAGGYQMATRADCSVWIKRLEKVKAGAKVSRSAMETLAIIAYKQPLVRAEIEQIRGVDTAGVLRTLLDRRLIRIVGRKDIPGRPLMYGTSKQFLLAFGLKDLADLPALRDIKDLGEPEQFVLSEPETIMDTDAQDAMAGEEVHG
jgi:segregation and condensation protein B